MGSISSRQDIINRHVRREWKTFLDKPASTKNPISLCGKRTKDKYLGVPGITDQLASFPDKTGALTNGWCAKCSLMVLEMSKKVLGESQPLGLTMLYDEAQRQCYDSLSAITAQK